MFYDTHTLFNSEVLVLCGLVMAFTCLLRTHLNGVNGLGGFGRVLQIRSACFGNGCCTVVMDMEMYFD
jgi:hypothetical protein